MKDQGELEWFLGICVHRNQAAKKLQISQASYIDKITKRFISDLADTKPPDSSLPLAELLPTKQQEEVVNRKLYQQKVGSILFAAISTRPDIAFAACKLSQFNARPNKGCHAAADRVLCYLYWTRDLTICYGRHGKNMRSYICASDASFADCSFDRKSSQGYIMKLFGGSIIWRANKQDTVTMSSTEAELLAISRTAKEAIYIRRLLAALKLRLPHRQELVIECDNRQTPRLLLEESARLQTKPGHVDIHNHWLRQEVQCGNIKPQWVQSQSMIADGLTKALISEKFAAFRDNIGLATHSLNSAP